MPSRASSIATLLGTSSAWPIPRPGCACAQCEEARRDPRLARTRSGLLVSSGGTNVLVDAGPDVAGQLERLREPPRVDFVVVTHSHLDHVLGLSDVVHLRTPSTTPLAVAVAPFHEARLRATFQSLWRTGAERVATRPWEAGETLAAGDVVLEGFETGHRREFPTTGVLLRVGGLRIAYATDMGDAMPQRSIDLLRGVDLFVGDGTYPGTSGHGHPSGEDALRQARALGARRVALTHIGHVGLADADLRRVVGPDVVVCRDGDDLLDLVPATGRA